jgi:2-amino-4-hydroxy-6-hydroxymethyldihydropteridine diphosphokinase
MALALIALGSNLGDRRDNLRRALDALRAQPGIIVERVSSLYETAPVGGPPGQGLYLNAAAALRTESSPDDLLRLLFDIETSLGRVRAERDGPRTIDLDLLFYDDVIRDEPTLTLPHPRLHQRLFVLQPLAEIAPGVVHPVLKRNIADLLADFQGVRTFGPAPGRELAGLRAVVTGSTSGIGKAIALELATGGADVIVHGCRSRDAAENVAADLRRLGVRSEVRLADLRERQQCQRLVNETWELWQGIDVWINNAGADTLTGNAATWPFELKLEELFAVDVRATLLLSRAVGERMKAAGGVILNMGWDQADTGMAGDSGELFAATKGAIMAFTRSLALSLAPAARVNCLAPGWIRTAWGTGASSSWQERVLRETPLERWGTPQDVAALARWLVSPAARYITGQVIRCNGGAVR